MPNLIKKLKTEDTATASSPEPVSLEELLLAENKIEEQVVVEGATPVTTEPVAKTRKARRQALRSNKVVAKRALNNPQEKQREQTRQKNVYQQRNREALLKRQRQANQKNKSGSTKSRKEYSASVAKRGKGARKEEEVVSTLSRPVVLAALDFKPCYRRRGRLAPSGKLLRLKRNARRVKLDRQVNPEVKDTTFAVPAVAKSVAAFTNSKRKFYDGLSPDSIEMYEEALSAFGLSLEENVSNTETVYTLLKEYASALQKGTSRLDESSERSLDGSVKLVGSKDSRIENYYGALRKGKTFYRSFTRADIPDIEVAIKCLISITAKELLYSFNMQRSNDVFGNVAPSPAKILQVIGKKSVLTVAPDPQSRFSAHSTLFRSRGKTGRKVVNNFPFESTEIISPRGIQTKSSKAFVEDLVKGSLDAEFKGDGLNLYSNPYSATVATFEDAVSKIEALTNPDEMELGDAIYVGLYNELLTAVREFLENSKLSISSVSMSILRAAALDKEVFGMLLVYLAFRQEKVTGYTGEESQTAGSSRLLRVDRQLRAKAGSASTGTVTKSFRLTPKDVSLSPAVGGESQFRAPEESTTVTIKAEPEGDFQEGTLESKFDITFEDICEEFGNTFYDYLRGKTNPSRTFTAHRLRTVGTSLQSVIDALQDTSSTGSPFDYLLNFESILTSALPAGDEDITSIFDDDGKTLFTGFPKRNVFGMFTSTFCKITAIALDGYSSARSTGTGRRGTITLSKGISKTKFSTSASKFSTAKVYSPSKSRHAGMASRSPKIKIEYSADFSDALSDLGAYLDSDEREFNDIVDTYPVIAAIGAALNEEEEFLRTFASSMFDYFTKAEDNFSKMEDALNSEVDGVSFRDLLKSGLTPALDQARILSSLAITYNNSDMSYSGVKVKDSTIGPKGLKFLYKQLEKEKFRSRKKVFVLGVPAGMLEDTETTPAEIGDVRKNKKTRHPDKFKISVQKIDQVRPEIEYEDLEFEFSRSLFCAGPSKTANSAIWAFIDKNLKTSVKTQNRAVRSYGMDVVDNHLTDFVIKQYADLQFDLDFNETAFPVAPDQVEKMLSKKVELNSFTSIDPTSSEFLSSSNLVFDPTKREVGNFNFYESDTTSLVLGDQSTDDVYAFSLFDYMNTYGSIFLPEIEQKRVSSGLKFDRVLCLLIDEDDFEIADLGDRDEEARLSRAMANAQMTSEKITSIGVPTSYGVDMNTYRFSITMEDTGEEI